MGDATADVGVEPDRAAEDRAVGSGRALRVELGHGPTLALVAVEQPLATPAAQDPGQLPADVEAVADRRVQSGAASRGHPVCGIPDQERVALSESLGQSDPEGDRHRTLDLDRQIGVAGGVADPPLHPLGGERLEADGSVPVHAEHPPVGPAGREEGAALGLVGDEVDAVAVLANEIPNRGAEEDPEALAEFVRALRRDAELLPDAAPQAVGADHVPGAYLAAALARAGKRQQMAALERDQLDPALETSARERTEVLLEQRLELVLCQAGGRSRADERRLLASRKTHLDRLAVIGGGERRACPGLPFDVDRPLPGRSLQPPAAKQFHRRRSRHRGARQRRRGQPPFDDERLDALRGKRHRARKTAGTRADDHDLELLNRSSTSALNLSSDNMSERIYQFIRRNVR